MKKFHLYKFYCISAVSVCCMQNEKLCRCWWGCPLLFSCYFFDFFFFWLGSSSLARFPFIVHRVLALAKRSRVESFNVNVNGRCRCRCPPSSGPLHSPSVCLLSTFLLSPFFFSALPLFLISFGQAAHTKRATVTVSYHRSLPLPPPPLLLLLLPLLLLLSLFASFSPSAQWATHTCWPCINTHGVQEVHLIILFA